MYDKYNYKSAFVGLPALINPERCKCNFEIMYNLTPDPRPSRQKPYSNFEKTIIFAEDSFERKPCLTKFENFLKNIKKIFLRIAK